MYELASTGVDTIGFKATVFELECNYVCKVIKVEHTTANGMEH